MPDPTERRDISLPSHSLSQPPLDPVEVAEMVAALRNAIAAIQKEQAAPDIMELYE